MYSRVLLYALVASVPVLLSGCADSGPMESASESAAESGSSAMAMAAGNAITGEGLPNPAPVVTSNWGDLPEGREWGSTAGIDIDPTDGQIWAYERCGAGNFGAGAPITCDSNPVDPIFKFDRNTGEVLANFGGGIMQTPHGIHADAEGNVWVTDFAGNADGTKGHQVHKFSADGELLMSLGTAGQTGNDSSHFNQPNDVIVGPDGSIYVSDGHSGQGMTSNQAIEEGREAGLTARIMKFSPDGTFIKEWGQIGVEHGEFRTPMRWSSTPRAASGSPTAATIASRSSTRKETTSSRATCMDVSAVSSSLMTTWCTPSIRSQAPRTTRTEKWRPYRATRRGPHYRLHRFVRAPRPNLPGCGRRRCCG